MNKDYAEDSLVRPESLGPIKTADDEVRLLTYLGELVDGTKWIYNESNRIVEAAGLALNLIREKNRQIMVARSESAARDDAIRRDAYDNGYRTGYESGMKAGAARERRKSKEQQPETPTK